MAMRMFVVSSTVTTVRRGTPATPAEKSESSSLDISKYPWLKTTKSFAVSMGRHEAPLPVHFKDKVRNTNKPDIINTNPPPGAEDVEESEDDNG